MRARRENAPYRFLHRNSLKPYDHLIGLELPDVVADAVKTLRHKKGQESLLVFSILVVHPVVRHLLQRGEY
jgi:hypothetical protein